MYRLQAKIRPDKKTISPKKIRQNGHIPATMFGKGMTSILLQLPLKEFSKFLEKPHHIFELEIEGQKDCHLVGLDHIQKNHLGDKILHVAFHKVAKGEKTTLDLPLVLKGEEERKKLGGNVQQLLHEITATGAPEHLPDFIEVDISKLAVNHSLHLKDIACPAGVEFKFHDPETTVAVCHYAKVQEKVTEEVAPEEQVA